MAEVGTIRSMLHITRLLAVIFGIIAVIGGIVYIAISAYFGFLIGAIAGGVYLVIAGVFAWLVWTQVGQIEQLVNARQYEVAKERTLLWMILGLIFGIILGIVLLLAYIKYDPVINAQRAQVGGVPPPPGYGAPPPPGGPGAPVPGYAPPPAPQAAAMSAPPPPPPAPPPPAGPFCPTCGNPGTYIAQYGRYYCYTDKQYL